MNLGADNLNEWTFTVEVDRQTMFDNIYTNKKSSAQWCRVKNEMTVQHAGDISKMETR